MPVGLRESASEDAPYTVVASHTEILLTQWWLSTQRCSLHSDALHTVMPHAILGDSVIKLVEITENSITESPGLIASYFRSAAVSITISSSKERLDLMPAACKAP
jgi:hypothetical protein